MAKVRLVESSSEKVAENDKPEFQEIRLKKAEGKKKVFKKARILADELLKLSDGDLVDTKLSKDEEYLLVDAYQSSKGAARVRGELFRRLHPDKIDLRLSSKDQRKILTENNLEGDEGQTVKKILKLDRLAEDAIKILVTSNQRWVTKRVGVYHRWAKQYVDDEQHLFDELTGYANAGLMEGIIKFDLSRGTRLKTYATYQIDKEIRRGFKQHTGDIRIPDHAIEILSKSRKLSRQAAQQGERLSNKQIAQQLGINEDILGAAQTASRARGSMDKSIGSDEEGSMHDVVVQDTFEQPDVSADRGFVREKTYRLLQHLTPNNRLIMKLLFGLGPLDSPMDKNEVAQRFGVSREKINSLESQSKRQIQLALGRGESVGIVPGENVVDDRDVIVHLATGLTPEYKVHKQHWEQDKGFEHLMRLDESVLLNLEAHVQKLPDTSRKYLNHRFGMGGKKRKTDKEMGDRLDIPKEQIRQMDAEMIEELILSIK